MRDVFIVGAARTPVGSFGGSLAGLSATKLGAIAIKAALERSKVPGDAVGEVIMGCVLPAGLGQAPARQAALGAGLPQSAGCVTINKVCGSGLKAVMLGAQTIMTGDNEVVVAGGMESMSNAPYLLPKARDGYRMGNQTVVDGMVHDGLWDAYNNCHMGSCADLCGKEKDITRQQQDEMAMLSYDRALAATKEGKFKTEIVPVEVPQRKGPPKIFDEDEEPKRGDNSKVPNLKPAFNKDGSVTAANASSINDGGAAVILASKEAVEKYHLKPMAKILGWGSHAQAPEWFTTAPAGAVEKALKKLNLKASDIDLYEINEAFAVVTLVTNKTFGLTMDNVNVWGGACSIGHPIGASGCRIFVTLLHVLADRGKKRGLATLCIGGGEAVAVVVERV
jgi:acetyl-CoA C-acetyltransferase